MKVKVFDSGDEPYKKWLQNHPEGYVLNTRRSSDTTHVIFHRSGCIEITKIKTGESGGFTKRKNIEETASFRAKSRAGKVRCRQSHVIEGHFLLASVSASKRLSSNGRLCSRHGVCLRGLIRPRATSCWKGLRARSMGRSGKGPEDILDLGIRAGRHWRCCSFSGVYERGLLVGLFAEDFARGVDPSP